MSQPSSHPPPTSAYTLSSSGDAASSAIVSQPDLSSGYTSAPFQYPGDKAIRLSPPGQHHGAGTPTAESSSVPAISSGPVPSGLTREQSEYIHQLFTLGVPSSAVAALIEEMLANPGRAPPALPASVPVPALDDKKLPPAYDSIGKRS